MNRIFDLTVPAERVRLGKDGRGEIVFSITNRSALLQRVSASLAPSGNTRAEWLSVRGEPDRELAANGTDQFIVAAQFPQGTQAGTYPFRLRVSSANSRSSEDFEESPIVQFEMPQVEDVVIKPRWWIWVAAAALLLVIGVGIVLATRNGGSAILVPDLKTTEAVEAIRVLQAQKLVTKLAFAADESVKTGQVISSEPPAKREVKKSDTVVLNIATKNQGAFVLDGDDATALSDATAAKLQEFLAAAPPPPPPDTGIDVPSLVGQNVVTGMETLQSRGLFAKLLRITSTQHAANIVLQQDPSVGTKVPPGSVVTLVIAQRPNFFTPILLHEGTKLNPRFRRETLKFNQKAGSPQ